MASKSFLSRVQGGRGVKLTAKIHLISKIIKPGTLSAQGDLY
jgi:hypothetical protein